jgi:tRNA(Ile2)-agmatinylcytidine synthase
MIAYRKKNKWGSKRFVDDKSVKKMDESFPSTFDNFDYSNNHNRLVPSSPCPILFGIRGENADDLIYAKKMIKSEEIDSWIIFESNQGTDEHLQRKKIADVKNFDSVIVEGVVIREPETIKGGHVIFKIKDETGEIDCAAYEPTKEFRHIIRDLTVGDILVVYGGVREKPLTVNLEKIFVKNLKEKCVKVENPVCPKCGKHMKSKGKDQGFKCVKCKTKSDEPLIEKRDRMIHIGFYEVPVCARRHLSKPLKRMHK